MTTKPQVAIGREFLSALSQLPLKVQKKVREFTEKFTQNPTSAGIHLEKLEGCIDEKVRSVRIDQAYRAIVVQPPRGDVFLCVWVDHHDKAYEWVRNKRFDVNPSSGVLQLFDMQLSGVPQAEPQPAKKKQVVKTAGKQVPKRFESHDDEALLLAGVPAPLLPAVRALVTDADLDKLAPHLPEDAAYTLYGLASGFSLAEAMAQAEIDTHRRAKVDVDDFATALAAPASQRQFKIVEGEEELGAMLERPLQQWRVFLHPTQQKLVAMDAAGPVRVLGGAGTGKTVVLMHRARHLAKQITDDGKVLVTTFTRNLAADLEASLRDLCGAEAGRVEVVNLHAWATQYLRRNGQRFEPLSDNEVRERRMDAAIEAVGGGVIRSSFYLDEWDRVVLAQEVMTKDDYLKARRIGRGTRLDRAQRLGAWAVFENYRRGLERDHLLEWQDVVREARLLLQRQGGAAPYRAVCADEVQDFTRSELLLLRALAAPGRNDLFLVGDGHQRIYGQPISLSQCGIDIRGRSKRLRLNYRTTDQIAKQGLAVLHGCTVDDMDGGNDSLEGYQSLRFGSQPELHLFQNDQEEAQFVVRKVQQWLEAGHPAQTICVAARTSNVIRTRYRVALQEAGIETMMLDKDADTAHATSAVRLSTMHRMKGLEFPRVLLASVQDGLVPLRLHKFEDDEQAAADQLMHERCLLYVACTRARDELVVAGYGKASPFLVS